MKPEFEKKKNVARKTSLNSAGVLDYPSSRNYTYWKGSEDVDA